MNRYYLIDFDNVASGGLKGCGNLTDSDFIYLFYTDSSKHISLDIIDDLKRLNFIKYKVPVRKQSVDMHLISYLGYLIGVNNNEDCKYSIISKDADYDNIIGFWREKYHIFITKNTSIAHANNVNRIADSSSDNLYEKIRETVLQSDYSEDIANRTAEIVTIHFGDENFMLSIHNDLQGEIENGSQIYQLIKPVMNKYGKVPQKNINMADKQILNKEVMNILHRLGYSTEEVGFTASVTVKNFGTEKGKFHTYLNLISKFGKAKGLEIYDSIRDVI